LKFLATLLLLALLVTLLIAAALFYLPAGPSSETFVDVAPGTGTQAIGAQLEAAHIIRTRYAFDLLRLYKGLRNTRPATLKAGEYRFDHPATVAEVYARLLRGDVYTLAVTIPEGYNIFDIAQTIESAGLGSKADFLAATRSHTDLIAAYFPAGTSGPTSLEGYLFPDTYHFSRHATPVQILTAMVHRFRQALTQLGMSTSNGSSDNGSGYNGSGDQPTNIPRTVLMASLIEKEVSQDSERPLVAGVFVNRLAQGMPLATDPTVIYAALLDNRWRGTIYASDLQNPSPYNTYRHAGLPPGPICSPGMAALRAALHPTPTDYLYFVADAAGHSRFSATLKEHNEQVQTYRESLGSSRK
jgi:UPF0755 protein